MARGSALRPAKERRGGQADMVAHTKKSRGPPDYAAMSFVFLGFGVVRCTPCFEYTSWISNRVVETLTR